MVSYSKFKECHLDLSSLKRSAAFLDKLEIDDLSLNYFFKNNGLLFHHMTNHAKQYNAADSFPLDVPIDINLITACSILARRIHTIHCTDLQLNKIISLLALKQRFVFSDRV